jgi:antitoxin component of MazEF toxin-antitoxin module
MLLKVEENGQVQIPRAFLDELKIGPGDEVNVSLTNSGVLIQSVLANRSLRGMFAGSRMLEMLIEDRTTISR